MESNQVKTLKMRAEELSLISESHPTNLEQLNKLKNLLLDTQDQVDTMKKQLSSSITHSNK